MSKIKSWKLFLMVGMFCCHLLYVEKSDIECFGSDCFDLISTLSFWIEKTKFSQCTDWFSLISMYRKDPLSIYFLTTRFFKKTSCRKMRLKRPKNLKKFYENCKAQFPKFILLFTKNRYNAISTFKNVSGRIQASSIQD